MSLMRKFGDTMGVLRFVDLCSDTGSGSADLIENDRFVLTLEIFDQTQNFAVK